MFGYVRPYKPELRFKEFDAYKAVYCSLCKEIGHRYGRGLRLTLSYDLTFLALLQLSQQELPICLEKKRCVCNPLKKCSYLSQGSENGEALALPAAASVLLIYYKMSDNIADEGPLKSLFYRFLRLFLKKAHRKAAADFPLLAQKIAAYITAQQQVELQKSPGVDAAAEPTAQMLSALFAACAPKGQETRALQRLGYCLGRWIYLIDAAADLKKDLKQNRFNPLAGEFASGVELQPLKARVLPLLNISAAGAAEAFELIEIKRFKNILGNIIYLGLQNSAAHLFKENLK